MNDVFNSTKLTTSVGDREILIETGRLANQAHGSVWVQSGDSVVLVTAVTQPLERDINFMPLVVDYQEMSYASGRIPGSYFRREIGRPSERETLVSRLIDRPIRPLFPDGFKHEVQIIATVLSADPDHDPDTLAITGASAALHLSKIPFEGPIAGGRVGFIEGEFILNPDQAQREQSILNLIVTASENAVVMVEGEAEFASEELVAEAIQWAHEQLKPLLRLQEELRDQVGKPKMDYAVPEPTIPDLSQRIDRLCREEYEQALSVKDKMERREAKDLVKQRAVDALSQEFPEEAGLSRAVADELKELESRIVRSWIRDRQSRLDGRGFQTVRPLGIEVGVLPRVHGSAIFSRGETKALGAVTLGSSQDEQHVETLSGELNKRFMLHYNFPPYCVGEVKMMRGPARREIGHGALAERSLAPILPDHEEFPFTIRIVSEIMESNGSSSMATVCAGSLALMDAGVPVKEQVAGIAMGLVKEGDEYFILTDILGDEDHLGDMDFKIAGSKDGITGIQMDIKISGIPSEVLRKALFQAREARLHILEGMNNVLDRPRQSLSEHAPQIKVIEVDPDRIKEVIGPGGKNIRAITKATGSAIDIEDDGTITIFAPNSEVLQDTIDRVLFYNQTATVGEIYTGKIKALKDFGAIVEILPGVEGMVHISQLEIGRVENIHDEFNIGDEIQVKVLDVEQGTGKIRLSRKAVLMGDEFEDEPPRPARNKRSGSGGGPQGRGKPPQGRGKPPHKKNG